MKKLTGVSYMSQEIGRGFPPATNHSCSMSNCIIMILESHRIIPFHARSTIKTFYVRSEIPNSPFSTHFIKNCSDVGCLVCSHFLSLSIMSYYTTLRGECQEESEIFSKYFSTLLRHATNLLNPTPCNRMPGAPARSFSMQYSAYISL